MYMHVATYTLKSFAEINILYLIVSRTWIKPDWLLTIVGANLKIAKSNSFRKNLTF